MWGRLVIALLLVVGVLTPTKSDFAADKKLLPAPSVSAPIKAVKKVSLNTATIKELRTLPGVGELLAQRIVAGRPYHSVAELRRIKGMTPNRYKAIAPRVTL